MSTILPFRKCAKRVDELKKEFSYPPKYLGGRPSHAWGDILIHKKVLHFGSGDMKPVPSTNNQDLIRMSSQLVTVDDDKESGADYSTLQEVPDRDLDTVWSEHVLEHIPMEDIPDVFLQIYNMLKPGGKFLFTVPNILSFGGFFTCWDHRNHAEAVEFAGIASAVCGFEVLDIFRWSKHKTVQRHKKWHEEKNELALYLTNFMWENYSLDTAQFVTALLQKPNPDLIPKRDDELTT